MEDHQNSGKPYTEIIVEIGTHLKTVKITLNIFAVWWKFSQPYLLHNIKRT